MSVEALISKSDACSAFCNQNMSLFEAAKKLSELDVNALAVTDESGVLVGIVTDHDIIRAVVRQNNQINELKTSEVMTSKVITCESGTTLTQVLNLMGKHSIRHIIVMKDNMPVSVLGIKDVLTKIHEDDELEVNVLRDIARAARVASI